MRKTFKQLRGVTANSVESMHQLDSLGDKVIVHDCSDRSYMVFDSHDDMTDFIRDTKECNRTFHEVIMGGAPQKLKMDIDMTREFLISHTSTGEIAEEVSELMDVLSVIATDEPKLDVLAKHAFGVIISAMYNAVISSYGVELQPADFVICNSTGKSDPSSPNKWSIHIIIDQYFVPNHRYAQAFYEEVKIYLPAEYYAAVDWNVNKSVQNFRIAGCHKSGSTRTKVMLQNGHQLVDSSYITYIEGLEQFNVCGVVLAPNAADAAEMAITDDETEKVIELAEDIAATHGSYFRDRNGPFFNYTRTHATYCGHCDRTHDNDNTLSVTVRKDGNSLVVYYRCRHATDMKAEYIGTIDCAPEEVTEEEAKEAITAETQQQQEEPEDSSLSWHEKRIVQHITDVKEGKLNKTMFDRLPASSAHRYESPTLRPFEMKPTLCVDAAMKMGKTKMLMNWIKDGFHPTEDQVIFMSFRQTFTADIKDRFPGFISYQDVEGPLTQKRLIVQAESLHRIDMSLSSSIAPKGLIIDESEAVFEQWGSGNHKSFNKGFAVFEWLLKNAEYVICMDANISDRTFNILKKLRPDFPIFLHHNTYKNAVEDTYYLTTDQEKWLGLLYSKLEVGERVAIPINSKIEANTIYRQIITKFPNLAVKLYSADTLKSEKMEHFSDVNTYWAEYDVIIYTPTVSAGVSFEIPYYNSIFAYFTDKSCSVETCIQMMGRIRSVSTRNYYIMLDYMPKSLPCTAPEIARLLHENREVLFSNNIDDSYLTYSYDKDKKIIYHNGPYFHLWVENKRSENLSRSDFAKRLIYLLSRYGSKFEVITMEVYKDATGNELTGDHSAQYATSKVNVKAEYCAAVAEAPDITEEEALNIKEENSAGRDVPLDVIRSYDKYMLRRAYRHNGNIDADFVNTYDNARLKKTYRNLREVFSYPDIASALEGIKRDDHTHYVVSMENTETQSSNVNIMYSYQCHKIALDFMDMIGFKDGLRHEDYVDGHAITETIVEKWRDIFDNTTMYARHNQLQRPKLSAIINARGTDRLPEVLSKMMIRVIEHRYDVKIKKVKNANNMLMLEHSKYFTFDPRDRSKPYIRYDYIEAYQPVRPAQE
jgi:hypothetical protein